MKKLHIVIISPALEKANNGNWQTARRWTRFLQPQFKVSVMQHWNNAAAEVMIALHARRSAASIAAFAAARPTSPLVVVLTGTDLYRDIRHDAAAQQSLHLASHLVVLQDAGVQELEATLQLKTHVIYQSARPLKPISLAVKNKLRAFDVCMVGHLRDEKDPLTFMRAAEAVQIARVRLWHIGGALDTALGAQASATVAHQPRYHWLGNLPHAATRQRIKRCHLLVIASKMEGGANVIIEAIVSGVPVLASDIPGNRGMLGAGYDGYFSLGDDVQLAALIDRAASDEKFYKHLYRQCDARRMLFTPQGERDALLKLVSQVINT